MGIELFIINDIKTQFINETKDVPIFMDGSKTLDDQLCYILKKELENVSSKLGSKEVPATPDIIRTLCRTAEEFESLAFRNYSIKCGAKISSVISTSNDTETTVLIQVFIGDKKESKNPSSENKAGESQTSAPKRQDPPKRVYRHNYGGNSYNTSTDSSDF